MWLCLTQLMTWMAVWLPLIFFIYLYNRVNSIRSMIIAWWLATCARKPKVPGSIPAASYVQR